MENRRPITPNAPRPFNRRNDFQKSEVNPAANRGFQTRNGNSPPRNEGFQKREEKLFDKNGKLKSPNNRFQPKNRSAPLRNKNPKPPVKQDTTALVSDLQVTDGKFFGKYLQTSQSPKTRTTSRRIREVMFRILQRRVRAGRFLDLCAGAGTIGIEAISRGALIGTFVERSAKMCGFIKKNLTAFNIKEGHGEIFEIEVVPFLKRMEKRRRKWDVVFFDPPRDADYDEILAFFSRGTALKSKGILVVEHPAEMFFPENVGVLNRWRVVAQDDTALSFYERK